MSTPQAKDGSTARCSSTSSPVGRWICCLSWRHPAWPHGSRSDPGIEIVCRDRAPFFADGATAGAPQAAQVADRRHLWHNLGGRRAGCRPTPPVPARPGPRSRGEADEPAPPGRRPTLHGGASGSPTASEPGTPRSTRCWKLYHSRRSIGRQLQMTHHTVKSLADAAKPEDLFRGQWQHNRTSVLDEYKPCPDERWDEGCTSAWKLWEEIVPLGYRGSYGRVSAYLREKPTSPRPVTAQPLKAPRVVTRRILSRPETLTGRAGSRRTASDRQGRVSSRLVISRR